MTVISFYQFSVICHPPPFRFGHPSFWVTACSGAGDSLPAGDAPRRPFSPAPVRLRRGLGAPAHPSQVGVALEGRSVGPCVTVGLGRDGPSGGF